MCVRSARQGTRQSHAGQSSHTIYPHKYIHARIHIHVYTRTYTRIDIHTHTHIDTYTHTHTHIHTYTHARARALRIQTHKRTRDSYHTRSLIIVPPPGVIVRRYRSERKSGFSRRVFALFSAALTGTRSPGFSPVSSSEIRRAVSQRYARVGRPPSVIVTEARTTAQRPHPRRRTATTPRPHPTTPTTTMHQAPARSLPLSLLPSLLLLTAMVTTAFGYRAVRTSGPLPVTVHVRTGGVVSGGPAANRTSAGGLVFPASVATSSTTTTGTTSAANAAAAAAAGFGSFSASGSGSAASNQTAARNQTRSERLRAR